jgi:hypothetical protein
MYQRLTAALLFLGLMHTIAQSSGVSTVEFVDGRWSGGIETSQNGSVLEECWASTTFGDGTTLTIAERGSGSWLLRLSNPDWQLPLLHRYDMAALVDFYPQLRVIAEVKNQTRLEIAHIDQIPLLTVIENGHTIDLTSKGFNEKYDLEGSAKIIERVRNCFAGQR